MENDDFQALAKQLPDNNMPHELAENLLRRQISDNIAPISMELDCRHLTDWADKHDLGRFRHKYIIQELKSWSRLLSHRPIIRICIDDPFELIDAPNFTELVYAVGQHFKVLVGLHVEHAVTVDVSALTSENIALLKGLNFNHIRLRTDLPLDTKQLKRAKQKVSDFKIDRFSLVVDGDTDDDNLPMQLMECLSFVQPETLTLSRKQMASLQQQQQNLATVLMQFGYYLHQGQRIIKFRSPFAELPKDRLRLGPEASSQFGRLCATNISDPDGYFGHIHKAQLPIAHCR